MAAVTDLQAATKHTEAMMSDTAVQKRQPIVKPKVGPSRRNDQCHCGSGKKHKRCHGRTHNIYVNDRRVSGKGVIVEYEVLCQVAGFDPAIDEPDVRLLGRRVQVLTKGQVVKLEDGQRFEVRKRDPEQPSEAK